MSINQNIRFADGIGNDDNPYSLYEFIKPPRWVFNNVDPLPTSGENEWFYTNTVSSDHFIKTNNTWTLVYNFATGAPSPGLTNIQNDGAVGFFKNIIGTTAHFKGISSLSGKLTFAQLVNDVDLGVNLNSTDVQLGNVQNIKSNFLAVVDPTNFNDSSPGQGYSIGSFWMNRSTNPSRLFICEVAIPTLAVWELIGGSGSGSIDTVANVGTGVGIFRDITGTTANLKSLASSSGKIVYTANADVVNTGVNLVPADVQLPLLINTKYVTNSASNPTVNDDASLGFQVGNLWSNYALGTLYLLRTNTVGAAIWDFIAPSNLFTRNDNDYAKITQTDANSNTAFGATLTPVLLNIGFSPYTLLNFLGTWSTGNSGFGPVNIIYGPARNGKVNDVYAITFNWRGQLLAPAPALRRYVIRMNIGNGGAPAGGVINDSQMVITFEAGSQISSTISKSFIYLEPGQSTINYFLSVVALDGTDTLQTTNVDFVFNQIV